MDNKKCPINNSELLVGLIHQNQDSKFIRFRLIAIIPLLPNLLIHIPIYFFRRFNNAINSN
jgi:hypothetical protein